MPLTLPFLGCTEFAAQVLCTSDTRACTSVELTHWFGFSALGWCSSARPHGSGVYLEAPLQTVVNFMYSMGTHLSAEDDRL